MIRRQGGRCQVRGWSVDSSVACVGGAGASAGEPVAFEGDTRGMPADDGIENDRCDDQHAEGNAAELSEDEPR